MNQEQSQIEIVKCQQHPDRIICFMFCKKECKYKSRLACNKCVKEYNKFEGFEDLWDVLKEPRVILNQQAKSDLPGIYDLLNQYFNILEQDHEQVLSYLDMSLFVPLKRKSRNQFYSSKRSQQKIIKDSKKKQQKLIINQAMGRDQLVQAFKDIMKQENHHQSQKWVELQQKVESFVLQFENQNQKRQEINLTCLKLKQTEQNFFEVDTIRNFSRNINNKVDQFCKFFDVFPQYSSLCDPLYFMELINRIKVNYSKKPKIIFKASQQGMNLKAFFDNTPYQSRLLIFCKSKCGHVFGGYIERSLYLQMPSEPSQSYYKLPSFLFSYTRKEIYPMHQNKNIVYCNQSGIYFGNSDLYISSDFQNGSSNLTGKDHSIGNYKIENSKIHLMGSEKPELVEMEVFQIL